MAIAAFPANKHRFVALFGTKDDSPEKPTIVFAKQTHSTHIKVLTERPSETIQDTDGLVTSVVGLPIGVFTADCIPVIYADPLTGLAGISHQGWKGTFHNMSGKMIDTMTSLGTLPTTLQVSIGPSIGACCYKVYGERYDIFREKFERFADAIFTRVGTDIFLNMALLNMLLLKEAGVPAKNIVFRIYCTKCDKRRFYSFQREGPGCNHMISYIIRTS